MNVMPVRLELFGSFATGTAAPTSDIDFVVYGCEDILRLEEALTISNGAAQTAPKARKVLRFRGKNLKTSLKYPVHICDCSSVIRHGNACIFSTFHSVFHFPFI